MPRMEMCGIKWRIASDDLFFPGLFELFIRVFWWIGIMILFTYHKGHLECSGKDVLHIYLVGLLVVLALIILSQCAVVYVSAQGSIMDATPRRFMPVLLYLRALLFIPELVWACLGSTWLYYNIYNCVPATEGAVIASVLLSCIIFLVTAFGVLFVFDPLRNLRCINKDGDQVWECRMRLMCWCLPKDKSHRAAFSNIAHILSDFLSDTDLVPSDTAAGLALLHQEQDKMEPEVVVDHSPSSPMGEDLETAAYWMQFAAAAYDCTLRCCRSTAENEISRGHLHHHFSPILQKLGLKCEDFVFVSFSNHLYENPFFVALDHKREAVVVAIRGTFSLEDALTDLSADSEDLPIEGVSGACYAHKGMCEAVHNIYKKLINDGILNQAFSIKPEYKLVITGHSLGAGTAALLAILLRNSFPTLQCYSFSPPGGLLSKALADYSKDFVVSVVLGKDLVPRLSIHNMEDLKRRILGVLSKCKKPKYRILLQGCWYELFGGDHDEKREGSLIVTSTYRDLFLPGRILYITEEDPRQRSCFSQVRYHADWSNEMEFLSILISPRMLTDHMSNKVLQALSSLTTK